MASGSKSGGFQDGHPDPDLPVTVRFRSFGISFCETVLLTGFRPKSSPLPVTDRSSAAFCQ